MTSKRERILERLRTEGWNEIVVRDAIVYSCLPVRQQALLNALCAHRGEDGSARLSLRTLGRFLDCHRDTAGDTLGALHSAGLVSVTRSYRKVGEVSLNGLVKALAEILECQEEPARSRSVLNRGTDECASVLNRGTDRQPKRATSVPRIRTDAKQQKPICPDFTAPSVLIPPPSCPDPTAQKELLKGLSEGTFLCRARGATPPDGSSTRDQPPKMEPTEEPEPKAKPTKRKRSTDSTRRCRLPSDWRPNAQHEAFAAHHGLDLGHEVDQFRDYHAARGSLMLDWDAALRTWLRNAIKFAKQRGERVLDDSPVPPAEDHDPEWAARVDAKVTDRIRELEDRHRQSIAAGLIPDEPMPTTLEGRKAFLEEIRRRTQEARRREQAARMAREYPDWSKDVSDADWEAGIGVYGVAQ